ncbi:MAG: hypothetical protein QOG39_1083, partial [Acidimicrobiaceae bacterium]
AELRRSKYWVPVRRIDGGSGARTLQRSGPPPPQYVCPPPVLLGGAAFGFSRHSTAQTLI